MSHGQHCESYVSFFCFAHIYKAPFGKDRAEEEKVVLEACGDLDEEDDDEMEEEEMFVDADPSFEHQLPEWGGPRRGGRLPEVRTVVFLSFC